MILLGMDTCGSEATLALARLDAQSRLLARLDFAALAGRTTAAMLVPALRSMLADASLVPASIRGIVVVDGPGSFTGIRIGVSTAKALCQALEIPLFAISRLRVLAIKERAGAALLDARRGDLYFYAAAGPDSAAEECLLDPGEIAQRMTQSMQLGPSLVACEAKVKAAVPQAKLVAAPDAFDALQAAIPDVLAGRSVDVDTLDGRYLRRSDLYAQTPSP